MALKKVNPIKKEYLTAGEVSKMLGIAQSTAVRFFDIGTLTGYKHPVTGWRVVDPKNVNALN